MSVVCCEVEIFRRADHSSRGFRVPCVHWVCDRCTVGGGRDPESGILNSNSNK